MSWTAYITCAAAVAFCPAKTGTELWQLFLHVRSAVGGVVIGDTWACTLPVAAPIPPMMV